ncbi:MAG: hypothetical protein GC159_21935 [Phycisphaera sp.]|nr:hypothetical protein [Phycisphaera sp.]
MDDPHEFFDKPNEGLNAALEEAEQRGYDKAWNRMLTVVVCLFAAGLTLIVPTLTPRLAEVFAGFETELPGLTDAILSVSSMTYTIVFGLTFSFAILKEFVIDSMMARMIVNYVLAAPLVLFALVYPFAMFLPMIPLLRTAAQ